MRNKGIAMNGPYSLYIKAVMSASKWGKKEINELRPYCLQKFRGIVFAELLCPGPVSVFLRYAQLAHVITSPH